MTTQKIIPFNVNEYCSWILSQNSPHNCIITLGIEGDINIARLKDAIKTISIDEPQLQYSISPDICGFISTNSPVPIAEIYQDVDWRVIGESELAKPFLYGDVLAKITVLKTKTIQYIILCSHHLISDGSSSIDFLLRIVNFYNYPKSLDKSVQKDKKKEFILPTPKPRVLVTHIPPIKAKTKIRGFHIPNELIEKIEKKQKQRGVH